MKNCKLLSALILLASAPLLADEAPNPIHPQMRATHTLLVGAFVQDAKADFYVDIDSLDLPKDEISLGDLGMSESDLSWLAEYRYRLSDKWLFSVGGYKFHTNGSKQARRTFEYNGVEFEAGAQINSTLSMDTFIADAMYKVYGSDRAEVFVGGGLHISKISTELKTKVFVDDKERTGAHSSDDVLAPLPNLRVQGMYAFTPKWALSGTLGWLSLNYDDYEGSFAYISGRLSYFLTDHLGFGVGYQYLDMDFSVQRNHGEAGVDIKFNGPSAYLSYVF